jgi:hypothetical protein
MPTWVCLPKLPGPRNFSEVLLGQSVRSVWPQNFSKSVHASVVRHTDRLLSYPCHNCRVPHISLVFREMWDTAGLALKPQAGPTTPHGCPTFASALPGFPATQY